MRIEKQYWVRKAVIGLACTSLLAVAACDRKSGDPGNNAAQAGEAQVGDQDAQKKFNAYISAMNMLVNSGRFAERIDYFERQNPQLKGNGPLTELYMMNLSVDYIIPKLEEAEKMGTAIPGVDEKAKALIPALKEASAINNELNAYVQAKEYTVDGGKKGRELAPRYLAALKAARDAHQQFSDVTQAYELQRDQAKLAKLDAGSLEFHVLTVSLAARAATSAFDKIDAPGADTTAFTAALAKVSEVNTTLTAFIDKAPKSGAGSLSSECQRYASKVNSMIGEGRTFAETVKSKSDKLADDANDFIKAFNDSVGEIGRCKVEDR